MNIKGGSGKRSQSSGIKRQEAQKSVKKQRQTSGKKQGQNGNDSCKITITDLDTFLCKKYNKKIDEYIIHHIQNYKINLDVLGAHLSKKEEDGNNFILMFGWNQNPKTTLNKFILNIYKDAYLTLRANGLQGYSKGESLTESQDTEATEAYSNKLANIMYSTYDCFRNKNKPITLFSVINDLMSNGFVRITHTSNLSELANIYTKARLEKIKKEVTSPIEINEKTTFNCILPHTNEDCFNKYMTDTFAWYIFNNANVQRRIHKYIIDPVNYAYFLRPIYKLFMLYDFMNVSSEEEEEDAVFIDESDDVEIGVKKYNSKININEPHAQDSTPYASMIQSHIKNKKFYNKCYFSINNTDESKDNYIHFNTTPTDLIQPNFNIHRNDGEIKICSYNLNWVSGNSKMISNHLKNILLSDIILLQELNFNNKEIITSNHNSTPANNNFQLTFSKDVYKILKKKRMINVISQYYKSYDDNSSRFLIPLYKSDLPTNHGSDQYNIIYFPNRVYKSKENVKLNAIMYYSDKINITGVFVGLLDSNKYLKYRHFCLCCKYKENNNEICVINIHLDTDYVSKIQLSEIKYLFYEIIQKEGFFRNIDRYIIGGDLNTEAYDIAIELIKMQKNFNKKQHELASFHKTILFNNIVTKGGIKSLLDNDEKEAFSSKRKKAISKNNGINLDNIIILDRLTIDNSSIKTYVGYNRKSGTTTDYFNHKDIKCHGIDTSLASGARAEYCKTHFSDHSPIFAVFPKRIGKTTMRVKSLVASTSPMDADEQHDSSVLEEKRNIELLSSQKKIKLLKELLNVFKNNSNGAFVSKYQEILINHLKSQNPPPTGLRRQNGDPALQNRADLMDTSQKKSDTLSKFSAK